ncbi:hypothetical protein [Streptomyces sp. NPDC049879]|uniref:hypothetical protein n=1 Tax=Streptomyces sp. NPDC049879 TaxID=3365598 RepID=UPI00378E7F3D
MTIPDPAASSQSDDDSPQASAAVSGEPTETTRRPTSEELAAEYAVLNAAIEAHLRSLKEHRR